MASASTPPPLRDSLPRLVLVLALVIGLAHAVLYDQPFEDSFITYRYADHLAHGAGLTYNAGEIVEGFTSFGWTILLAGVSWLGLPLVALSRVLSVACALACLPVTLRLARQWMGRDDVWSVAPTVLVAANGTWAYYAMTGMETSLFALLVNGALLLATSESRDRTDLAALALAAAALVRPEGLGYFVAVALALAFEPAGRRALRSMLAIFVAVFAPYFAWRWHHFGYPLPNTYYAKASFSTALSQNGLAQVEAYFTSHAFWLVPVAVAFLVLRQGWRRPWRLGACVVGAAVANTIFVGGDVFPFYRFLLPAIPAGVILIVAGCAALAEERGPKWKRGLGVGVLLFVVLTFVVSLVPRRTFTAGNPISEHARATGLRRLSDDYELVGDWLRRSFPEGTTIAVNAAGIVPYVSGLRTIDMLGLNDAHIAHLPVRLGTGNLGHEKHDAAYVLSRAPDVILLGLPTLMKRPLAPGELGRAVSQWFPYLPGDRELYESETFRRDYAPLGAQVAPDKYIVVFVRRTSPLPR